MQHILYTTADSYKTKMCLIFKAYVYDKIRLEGSYLENSLTNIFIPFFGTYKNDIVFGIFWEFFLINLVENFRDNLGSFFWTISCAISVTTLG